MKLIINGIEFEGVSSISENYYPNKVINAKIDNPNYTYENFAPIMGKLLTDIRLVRTFNNDTEEIVTFPEYNAVNQIGKKYANDQISFNITLEYDSVLAESLSTAANVDTNITASNS